MEFFLVAGPNVSLEKLCYSQLSVQVLSLEDTGLFLDRSGRNLIWEFCLLEVPEPQRSVVCPFWRPLIELPWSAVGTSCHGLFRRQHTAPWGQVLYRLGSGGLWHSENPRFYLACFSLSTRPGPHPQLLVPLGKPQRLSATRCLSSSYVPVHVHTHTTSFSPRTDASVALSLCWGHGRAAYTLWLTEV